MSVAQHFTQTGATKRAPISGGKGGAPAIHLSGLACTMLFPDSRGEIRQRLKIDSPYEVYSVTVMGNPDIVQGDVWVQGGVEYAIRAVGKQEASLTGTVPAVTELVIEKVLIKR